MRAIGFFHAEKNASIPPREKDDVARKLADVSSGWSVVAVGGADLD
jgi:hypothetical protein